MLWQGCDKVHKQIKNHHGFTLVEVIIVMVIIAVAATITIPSFIGYIDTSRDKSDTKSIEMVLEAVETECSYKRYRTVEFLASDIEEAFKNSIPADAKVDNMVVTDTDEIDGITTRLEEETKIINLTSGGNGDAVSINILIVKESNKLYSVELNAMYGSISKTLKFNPAVRTDIDASEEPTDPAPSPDPDPGPNPEPDPDPTPTPEPSASVDMESVSDYMKNLFFKDGSVSSGISNQLDTDVNYSDGNSIRNKMISINNEVNTNLSWPQGDWWNLFDKYSNFAFRTAYFNRNGETNSEKKTRVNNYAILTFMNVYVQKYADDLGISGSFTSNYGTFRPYFYFKDMSTKNLLEVDADGNFVNLDNLIIFAYNDSNYFFSDPDIWYMTTIKYIDGETFDSYAHLVYYPDKTNPAWYLISDSEKGQKINGIYDTYDKIANGISSGALVKVVLN